MKEKKITTIENQINNKILTKPPFRSQEYQKFIRQLKSHITQVHYNSIRKINNQLIILYYSIGMAIYKKQKQTHWGNNFISQVEKDLKKNFPKMRGFSRSNLFYMKKLYIFFGKKEKIPQLVGQIPWGHIRLILDKLNNVFEAEFYIKETIKNNWSRLILERQIKIGLFRRQGKLQSNFDKTLKNNEVNILEKSFKKSYVFDFLSLSDNFREKELENELIKNLSNLILELGKGFAFIGKQYKLKINNKNFFIDLLFYNFILKRFIIVELKNSSFKPKYVGQIGFYMSAINKKIKTKGDKETIGLIICKSKSNTIVEYALENINKPTGVAEYKFINLPDEIVEVLPNEKFFKCRIEKSSQSN